MAAKTVKWSENRIRDFFQEIVKHFGPYVRSHWLSARCIDDKRGLPISKYEFDQTMRTIERTLAAKWANDGDPLPINNGYNMMLAAVTAHSSLVAWSSTQHDKTRAIAVEVGFITERDLSWLKNLSLCNKR